MTADYISMGYTMTSKQVEEGLIDPIVRQYRPEIEVLADDIDPQGRAEATDQPLIEVIIYGARIHMLDDFPNDTWDIGDTGREFVSGGFSTWGDAPFEGYDELIIFVTACGKIPALGEEFGVYGGGIVLPS